MISPENMMGIIDTESGEVSLIREFEIGSASSGEGNEDTDDEKDKEDEESKK